MGGGRRHDRGQSRGERPDGVDAPGLSGRQRDPPRQRHGPGKHERDDNREPQHRGSDADQRLDQAADPAAEPEPPLDCRQAYAFAVLVDDRLVIDVFVHLDAVAGAIPP